MFRFFSDFYHALRFSYSCSVLLFKESVLMEVINERKRGHNQFREQTVDLKS